MPGGIQIAPARPEESMTIALLSRDEVESGLGWRWRPSMVAAQIERADTEVIVAREQNKVIGFGIMRFQEDDAHLLLLAVAPSHRRIGLGEQLLRWLETMARAAGTFRVHVEVRVTRHDARRFYRAMGYREIRVMPGYYQGRESAVRVLGDLRARV